MLFGYDTSDDAAVYQVDDEVVVAPFTDMDPRELDINAILTISDKVRALGGAVMDAIMLLKYEQTQTSQ